MANWGNVWRQVGNYTGLALMLPAAALIGYFIGTALDGHFKTGRVFTVAFLLLGFAAGLIEIVRTVSRDTNG